MMKVLFSSLEEYFEGNEHAYGYRHCYKYCYKCCY